MKVLFSQWSVFGFAIPKGKRSLGVYDFRPYGVDAVALNFWAWGLTFLRPSAKPVLTVVSRRTAPLLSDGLAVASMMPLVAALTIKILRAAAYLPDKII